MQGLARPRQYRYCCAQFGNVTLPVQLKDGSVLSGVEGGKRQTFICTRLITACTVHAVTVVSTLDMI